MKVFFGIPLWALLLAASIVLLILVRCVIQCFCFIFYHSKKSYKPRFSLPKSIACKHHSGDFSTSSLDKKLLSASWNVSGHVMNFEKLSKDHNHDQLVDGIIKDGYLKGLDSVVNGIGISKGCCFSLKEIEGVTNGLAKENVIGSGDNGIVYLGLLPNHRLVAVKRLARDRMSVSEYVENESLHHWLHEFPVLISPLTWEIRMKIIHGVAKGLAYLHEGVKPKILHGSIKSSNILLDHQWNPKISDFGLVKVQKPECSHIILEVEASGYEAPDCHSSSTLTEGNDIYDFGLLIMEILSGRIPSYHSQPQAHIVDWFKSMISNGKIENVVDPKLLEMPSSIVVVKRVALVALRCVDPDINPRLKMGDVVCMLETNLLLFEERQIAMETYEHNYSPQNPQN